ncbi:L [Lonestar tick chuvirus 1]|uniref:Replicase n=1 Tax=Lonestar tick chuvirus 1 TaxID=1844927 RepID=A0A172MHM9_9VIRU|nr:L [Lonestar tick chuvirus 1] [Lonestar tick chuvirus 1]ANC97697.1 L [Lonestar tick chuvirus 1] [Lonestar tick chuvirus 1]
MSQRQPAFSPHELIFDKKFDVALRLSHAKMYIKKIVNKSVCIDETVLLRSCSYARIDQDPRLWVTNYHVFPEIYLKCLSLPVSPRDDPDIKKTVNVMSAVIECQLAWNMASVQKSLKIDATEYIRDMKHRVYGATSITKLIKAKKLLDRLVKTIPVVDGPRRRGESSEDYINRVAAQSHFHSKELGLKVAWSRRSCVLSTSSGTYLLPRSYLLLIHNKIMDILSVLVYAACCPRDVYDTDLLEVTTGFLEEWMKLALRKQQTFFTISKVWEGICIGESLLELEGEKNRQFLRSITTAVYEQTGFEYEGSYLCYLYRGAPLPVKHELSCLSKVAGHPFVDVELTAETLEGKVNEKKAISITHIERARLYAVEDYIRQFRKKEGKWPPVKLLPGVNPSLVQAQIDNADPKSLSHHKKHGTINVDDYTFVEILPCLDFDWVDNFIPFVKDRTISFLKDEVVRVYLTEDEERTGKRDINWSKTRALLLYLLWPSSETDHLQYMRSYVKGEWDVVANYLVIRLVPKEREHKIAARAFGCKTTQDRARSIIQELNVARFLDKYSDEHVMTQGELDVAKKLLGFRMLGDAYKGYRMIIIQVDASSWNSRFRHESVAPIAAVLDNVYNVKIFSRTHEAFEMSFVYMPDGLTTYSWDGQLGGIEGLQQYTWVFVYVHHVKVCMEQHPYPFYILCKGDDLRIAVMVPPQVIENTSIDSLKQRILTTLADEASKMGHVLKVEDSYASECYFAYSKNTFVNNVEQPQAFRKIQKCHGANNAFLSTIDDYIGSAYSNAHSAAKTAPSPIPCYLVALFWSVLHLAERPDYKALSESEMAALLQVPNLLGGLPVVFLHNFFVRAESDLLPPFLDMLEYFRVRWPTIHSLMYKFLHQQIEDTRKSFAGLMADPYSLPLKKPQAVSTILRQEVTKLLQTYVRNEKVRELFILSKGNFDEQLLDCLFSADVWNLKLLSSCYNCGPNAIVAELIRKFESGRSIYNLLLIKKGRGMANRVLTKCLRAEKALCDYRFQILRRRLKDAVDLEIHFLESTCSWEQAQILREVLWGKVILGVTQPCVQHQIQVGDQDEFECSDYTGNYHFKILYKPPDVNCSKPLFTIGPYRPFVGATTGCGLGKPEARIPVENVFTPKVRTLMQLYQWGHATKIVEGEAKLSNFPLVVKHLLEGYTRSKVEHLMPFVGSTVSGRTIQHHVRASNYRQSIVPNTLLNIFTRAKGDSHSHNFYTTSPDHFLVNFLQVYCMMVSFASAKMWVGQSSTRSKEIWAVTTNCQKCTKPITEEAMFLSVTGLPPLDIGEDFQIGKKAIAEIAQAVQEFDPEDYYMPDEDTVTVEEAETCLVQHCMNKLWERHVMVRESTQHVLDAEGQAALEDYQCLHFSREEHECFSVASFDEILKDLAFMIYWDINVRYYGDTDRSKYVAIANTPPSELPWTGVLRQLDTHRRFNKFQRYCRRAFRMGSAPIVETPESFSAMFGQHCHDYYTLHWKGIPTIANMGTASDPRVKRQIQSRIYATRLSYLDKMFMRVFSKSHPPENPTSDPICLGFVALVLTSARELVFGTSELSADRIRMRLFEPLEDPIEEIMSYDMETEEYMQSDGTLHVANVMKLPLFTQMCCVRYDFPITHAQSIAEVFSEEPVLYEDAFKSAVEALDANPEMVIIRTNEVTCLSKIREYKAFAGFPTPVVPRAEFPPLATLKVRGFHTTIKYFRPDDTCGTCPTDIDLTVELPSDDITLAISTRVLNRPVGSGNISMSKLASLLSTIGISGLPPYCNVACLGDGYGGFTAVFAALGDGTTNIVYNTQPDRLESVPSPIVAHEVSDMTRVTINEQCILMGYTDLTKVTTCTYLEQQVPSYAIVCLDAEVPGHKDETEDQRKEREHSRHQMIHNVTTLFLRKGNERSLLIMKVYMQEVYLWLPALTLLAPASMKTYLVRCDASANDGELFIVSQLVRTVAASYGTKAKYPPYGCIKAIRKFFDVYVNRATHDPTVMENCSCKHSYSRLQRRLLPVLPIYGWSKFEELCKITLPPHLKRFSGPDKNEWLSVLEDHLANLSMDEYLEMHGCYLTNESETYQTLTHTLVVGYRFLTTRAFMHVTSLFRQAHIPLYRAAGSEVAFLQAMQEFPRHLNLAATLEFYRVNKGRISVHNIAYMPLPYWMQGIRWGLSALTASMAAGLTEAEVREFVHRVPV